MTKAKYDVVAIGNALVDILATVSEDFLVQQYATSGMVKGSMNLINEARAAEIYSALSGTVDSPGGSAGNTIAGFASFGGKGAYIGKVANDAVGQIFRREMGAIGVDFLTSPLTAGTPTGHCTVLVSPDGQRTMNTFLGAAVQLTPDDIDEKMIADAGIVYLEGYLFDPTHAKEAFRKAAKAAHEAGRLVALSLSDSFCVDRHRADFQALVAGHVDILFANESEILSLRETDSLDAAIAGLKDQKLTVIITRGAQGATITGNGQRIDVPAAPAAEVTDTTGAGDQFAAGFLFGLSQNLPLAKCGHLGALAAAEVISHLGPRPLVSYAELARAA